MTVLSLAVPLVRGLPVPKLHPGINVALMRRHGDYVRPDGTSGANELIVMGGHTGTHIDALGHFSDHGVVHGGVAVDDVQGGPTGGLLLSHDVDSIPPFVGTGLLIDMPELLGVECLEAAQEITVEHIEQFESQTGVQIEEGSAVLFRTGWMAAHYQDAQTYLGQVSGVPGIGPDAAGWLAGRGVTMVGADTHRVEVVRFAEDQELPVHRDLLVGAGIYLLEMLSLDELARLQKPSFQFICAPIRLVGATGVPVNPLAVVEA